MRKIVLSFAILAFFAVNAYPAAFQPSVLKITAPSAIKYAFDGTALTIPVTVAGTPADVSFMVFTQNMSSKVASITNGYLGWHFVNRIDTCVYMSTSNSMDKGSANIIWDGKDKAGAKVAAGTYTYYMFGYDNKSAKVAMTKQMSMGTWNYRTILEKDAKGVALAKPIIYQGDAVRTTRSGSPLTVITVDYNHTNKKWVVGNDPDDATLLETCVDTGLVDVGGLAFLPTDQSYFFHDTLRNNSTKVTKKWKWVPNGTAVLDTNWGTNGETTYSGAWPGGWNYGPGCVSDGADYLYVQNGDISGNGKESKIMLMTVADGTIERSIDVSQWWVNLAEGDAKVGGQFTGGPTAFAFRNGRVALGSHSTCVNSVMDLSQAKASDSFLWVNRNGDGVGDHNFSPTSPRPWVCNDYNVGPYKYNVGFDNNGFVTFPSYDQGAVSFGLFAPDGTGIAYKSYAGENAGQKYGTDIIDYGSAYDGIYTTLSAQDPTKLTTIAAGFWFIGHDSIKGTISNVVVGVDEAAPSAFAVAQNSPNPFNPTTSINFTLAKAGKVTVDVFNAAGQKVDTIVNTTMNAGAHSVNWNASKFSAGVYFYTVKSGDFSKTMKMTLLK